MNIAKICDTCITNICDIACNFPLYLCIKFEADGNQSGEKGRNPAKRGNIALENPITDRGLR